MVGNGLGQAIDKGRIIGHIHNRARQVAGKLIATEQIGFSILAEEGGLDSVLFHDLVPHGAPGFPARIRVMEKQVITIGPFEQVGVLVCPLEDGTEPGLVISRDVSQHRWQFFHLLSGFHLRVVARVPGPLLLEIEAALVNDRCLDLHFARGHSLPISGREEVLRLACGAVASGGYYPDRAGDGELTLNVSQTLPTAIGTPHRMPEVPISGREQVLRLACDAVASGGYYPDRAGDRELALNVSMTMPTANATPQSMPQVPN